MSNHCRSIPLAAALLWLGACHQASTSDATPESAARAGSHAALPTLSLPADALGDVVDHSELPVASDTAQTAVPTTEACASAEPGYEDAEVARRIQADVAAMGGGASDQTMYVSLAHLADGRSECDMRELRFGVGKLINMMSWAPDIQPTHFIDEHDYIARVDVQALKWTPDSLGYMVQASDHLDYGVVPGATPTSFRADWLSQHLTKPTVYGYIMQNPATERAIEAAFGVDPLEVGKFAGVSQSIVTLHPRLIERRQGDNGACWVTHDFLHRPQALAAMETGELPQSDLRFGAQQYIAREYICALPNGMHSYHLTGFVSQRRWDGNTCVAQNRSRDDKLVLNGQCFSCHGNGLNEFEDEVRPNLASPSDYVMTNFPERDAMKALFDKDQAQFDAAVSKIPYYEQSFNGPLNVLMAIYSQRSGDDMRASPAGAFGAILPNGATAGPFWEDAINPLATLAVDVGVLLPAEVLFEDIPEVIVPGLEAKYREVGLDPNVNCD